MERELAARLAERRGAGLYRAREVLDGPAGPRVRLAGREYLAFCSNDYLGLAGAPEVVSAWRAGLEQWGAGAGAAHLVTGHARPHHELEEALADFVGRPRALLFSTGYMANLGVLASLAGAGDLVLEDRLNHASLLDGGLLSRARLQRYPHADPAALDARLARARAGRRLVVTDAVFSMDGDLAPLPALAETAARHGAWLAADDAHGLGVLGATGRGSLEHYGLAPERVPILVGTLGKAFGTFGAFVAGSEALIETLIQFARSYVYTTALPPALACATLASLQRVRDDHWRRERLRTLIARFRRGAGELGLPLAVSESPIQPIVVGDAQGASALAAALRERGVLVTPIRPPTVPEGTARLRITFSASHTEADVDRLLAALEQAWAARGEARA